MPLTVNGVNIENVNVNGSPIERVVVNGVEVWSKNTFVIPTFTGSAVLSGDAIKGQLIMKSSGTLTLSKATYDVFAVGGGAVTQSGFVETILDKSITAGNYNVSIGAGINTLTNLTNKAGDTTIANIITAMGAGNSKTRSDGKTVAGSTGGGQAVSRFTFPQYELGRDGGSDGSNGETFDAEQNDLEFLGFGETTRAFKESTNTLYASGGGGAPVNNTNIGYGGPTAGNSGRGGSNYSNGTPAQANSGSGGGEGGMWVYNSGEDEEQRVGAHGYGGSGVAIIRWGY